LASPRTGVKETPQRRQGCFNCLRRRRPPLALRARVDHDAVVFGEQAENINRKDFTPARRDWSGDRTVAR
jgi:hypothetical protein